MANDESHYDELTLQAALESAGTPWVAAFDNPIAALSTEQKRLRLGYVPGPGEPSLVERETLALVQYAELDMAMRPFGAPASFDLRNVGGKNFISAIKDQGSCGSCVSFGSCATVEGTTRFARNDANYVIDCSEAHLFYCHARAQGRRCSGANGGWWVPPALDAFKNLGVADDACYPYTPGDADCTGLCSDWQSRVTKIKSWTALSSAADMKTWLSTKGPLVSCFTVYADFFNYQSGVYKHVTGGVEGGHCVCTVGYNDADKCWILKNSWGTGWGEQGYVRMGYGEVGIDQTMWAVEVGDAPAPVPTGVWYNNKRITGLWANSQERNTWAYIDTVGWKRVSPESDMIYLSLVALLSTAKGSNRPVNAMVAGDVIKEVYVL